MLVYNYDRITKEYTYSQEAELDREESRIRGYEVYLIPAYATLQEPLSSKQGYAVIFDGSWKYTPDHRGKKVVNPETEEIVEGGIEKVKNVAFKCDITPIVESKIPIILWLVTRSRSNTNANIGARTGCMLSIASAIVGEAKLW